VVTLEFDRQDLTDQIHRFREAIFKKDPRASDALSQALYTLLIRPVEKHLQAGRLIIVPDNALFYLPFAALHDGRAYLIERYGLAYTPSMGILKFAQAKARSKSGRVLALGNPDLGNPDLALPCAQAEAQKVADRYPGSKVYVAKAATETTARTAASRFDIIHFATHGEFSTTDPLYSSLRLAADSHNDGRLEAAEIFSLRISPWLVTLSACRTGLGVVTNGGEIIGLNRSFIYAGAPAVVSSLWSIGDASTALLMEKFYENLKSMPRDAALRAAQVDMLQGGQFTAPFYWAAFYLTGDFR
jgi:CHAT domain-containing protein